MECVATNKSNIHALHELTQLQFNILRHLSYYASKSWGFCRKTYQTIADELGCSLSTVEHAISKFKKTLDVIVKNGGCTASRIYIPDWIKQYFCNLRDNCGIKHYIPYIKTKKTYVCRDAGKEMQDNQKPNTENKPDEGKKNAYKELEDYGFRWNHLMAISAHVKMHRIGSEALKEAIDAYGAYVRDNAVSSPVRLFKAILNTKHKEIADFKKREAEYRAEEAKQSAIRAERSRQVHEEMREQKIRNQAIEILEQKGIHYPKLIDHLGKFPEYKAKKEAYEVEIQKVISKINK